jgi:hypothetical protein
MYLSMSARLQRKTSPCVYLPSPQGRGQAPAEGYEHPGEGAGVRSNPEQAISVIGSGVFRRKAWTWE